LLEDLPAAEATGRYEANEPFAGHWSEALERQHLREAALAGNDEWLDESIETHGRPGDAELAIHRRLEHEPVMGWLVEQTRQR
jgi:hypothetical protein